MSHRSNLAHHRSIVQASAPRFPNMQARPPEQKMTLDQIVPMLLSQGAPRECRVAYSVDEAKVQMIAVCGPLGIPFELTAEEALGLAKALSDAADAITPGVEVPVVVSDEAEALLAEFIAAASENGG